MDDDQLLDRRWWTEPGLIAEHRLPMRSPLVPCPDDDTARATTPTVTSGTERTASPWFQPLDGSWRFLYAERPADVPVDAADPRLDDSAWPPIDVPGNWTMQ